MYAPKEVTLSGIVILFIPESANALTSIFSKPLFKFTFVSLSLSENVPLPIILS